MKSLKRTAPPPFFSWASSQERSGAPCHKCHRRNKAQPLAQQGHCWAPKQCSQEERSCPSQSIQGIICRGDWSKAVSILGFSSRESNSLSKRSWQGCPARHSSQESLSLPSQPGTVWLCCCSHHKKDVTAVCKYTERGRKLGSKRNAICCHAILRISYFKSQTWIQRTWGRGGKTIYRHNLLHGRAVNSRPACQKQQCANNPNWLQSGSIRTTLTQWPQAARLPSSSPQSDFFCSTTLLMSK